jgi:hypothetical protein
VQLPADKVVLVSTSSLYNSRKRYSPAGVSCGGTAKAEKEAKAAAAAKSNLMNNSVSGALGIKRLQKPGRKAGAPSRD